MGSPSVLLAMSGGVDSSVAAALLKNEGYRVTGISMNMLNCMVAEGGNCCSASDRMDARKICEGLGLLHLTLDCRENFRRDIILPFIEEYLSGRTPSPCVSCNSRIKFPELMENADKHGIEYISTGHYARIEKRGGVYRLLRSVDEIKDQSYFLFELDQEILSRLIFPVGGMMKKDVRRIAVDMNLSIADKADSQEICFVSDGSYSMFLEEHAGSDISGHGNFVDVDGNVLGSHSGIHSYTIGQRRGIGFGTGSRRYVVAIDSKRNEVVLGNNDDLMKSEAIIENVNWIYAPVSNGKAISVKIRSRHAGAGAKLYYIDEGVVRLEFDSPVRAITPGQAAVFYDGDEVLGGGWIR